MELELQHTSLEGIGQLAFLERLNIWQHRWRWRLICWQKWRTQRQTVPRAITRRGLSEEASLLLLLQDVILLCFFAKMSTKRKTSFYKWTVLLYDSAPAIRLIQVSGRRKSRRNPECELTFESFCRTILSRFVVLICWRQFLTVIRTQINVQLTKASHKHNKSIILSTNIWMQMVWMSSSKGERKG